MNESSLEEELQYKTNIAVHAIRGFLGLSEPLRHYPKVVYNPEAPNSRLYSGWHDHGAESVITITHKKHYVVCEEAAHFVHYLENHSLFHSYALYGQRGFFADVLLESFGHYFQSMASDYAQFSIPSRIQENLEQLAVSDQNSHNADSINLSGEDSGEDSRGEIVNRLSAYKTSFRLWNALYHRATGKTSALSGFFKITMPIIFKQASTWIGPLRDVSEKYDLIYHYIGYQLSSMMQQAEKPDQVRDSLTAIMHASQNEMPKLFFSLMRQYGKPLEMAK
ncbi:hypothetical protein C4573_02440 [Candidatus Woesearchaeota archaeon]|nr:MAG: hypothetical protein C4573_02440 [Candidatus Woesearchaeota archaeon]